MRYVVGKGARAVKSSEECKENQQGGRLEVMCEDCV